MTLSLMKHNGIVAFAGCFCQFF